MEHLLLSFAFSNFYIKQEIKFMNFFFFWEKLLTFDLKAKPVIECEWQTIIKMEGEKKQKMNNIRSNTFHTQHFYRH